MVKKKSLISVIIPISQRFQFVSEVLKSIESQSTDALFDVEIIVVEHFKDNPEILTMLTKIFPKIIPIRNYRIEGPGGNRNEGLIHAHGEYVVFFDSDDIMHQYFLKELYLGLKSDPNAIVAHCYSNYIFQRGFKFLDKIKLIPLISIKTALFYYNYYFNYGYLPIQAFYLCQISHMMFKIQYIKNLRFNKVYRYAGEDWDFFSKVFTKGAVRIVPRKLVTFRYAYGSMTYTRINLNNKWKSYLMLISRLPQVYKNNIYLRLFRVYVYLFGGIYAKQQLDQ